MSDLCVIENPEGEDQDIRAEKSTLRNNGPKPPIFDDKFMN